MLLIPSLLAAFCLTGLVNPTEEADPSVLWKGKSLAVSKLPEAFADARKAVLAWSDWSAEREYQLELDDSGSVLLVAPLGDGGNKARARAIERTRAFIDKKLPLSESAAQVARSPGGKRPAGASGQPGNRSGDGPREIPEDPVGNEPLFGDVERPSGTPRESWAWGAGTRALNSGTVTMFVLRGPKDYVSLLAELVEAAPYLDAWADGARSVNGFAIFEPLAGAMLLNAPGMEEWDPEAELVHRLATLLITRRFGQQPYWLTTGFSWYTELELRKGIYCFPFRDGFVGIGEHAGWGAALRRRYEEKSFEARDLLALTRGRYDDQAAGVAWGLATFLGERHQDVLPELLVGFYRVWDAGSRIDFGGGNWERDREWSLTTDEQSELFAEALGADFAKEFTAFLASGCEH